MPTAPLRSTTPTIDIYVKLAQYPILCDRIRLRMREELFRRGIIDKNKFEQQVKELAIESQRREGLSNPSVQEDENTWQKRLETIRDLHTDNYFANNLGSTLLEQLIEEVLSNQETPSEATELTFNPEIAPWALLFQQGEMYDALPPPEKEKIKHHLEEIKVVLIKRLLSDQLAFIGVAKRALSISDLRWIYERLIGGGKIGGKAGGMVLAWRILDQNAPEWGPNIGRFVDIPETYFLGSELIYEFILQNKLERFVNQKYLPLAEMQAEYPRIKDSFIQGKIPAYIVEQLSDVLTRLEGKPLVVRSSSLLEDHLDHPFVGKYASHFCPNQGAHQENLADLLDAIRHVYASIFNPTAMLERQQKGLIDYDERMAIMIQPLIGRRYGRYFLPTILGSGMSHIPWRADSDFRPEDGCLRLVLGLGKRIDTSLDSEESCLIALSHPQRRPETDEDHLKQTTQTHVKVVDMVENGFKTVPLGDILQPNFPFVSYLAEGGDPPRLTFKALTQDDKFVRLMRFILTRLEKVYGLPVQVEFTVDIRETPTGPDYQFYILQCHPISSYQ